MYRLKYQRQADPNSAAHVLLVCHNRTSGNHRDQIAARIQRGSALDQAVADLLATQRTSRQYTVLETAATIRELVNTARYELGIPTYRRQTRHGKGAVSL